MCPYTRFQSALIDKDSLVIACDAGRDSRPKKAVENVYRLQIMNRMETTRTCRVAASGIDGLQVLAVPAQAGPAAVLSMPVSLRLPFAAAQGLAGRSMPVVFQVTGADSAARQFETSVGFLPC